MRVAHRNLSGEGLPRRGFTLTELMIVSAIVSLFMFMLFPAINMARHASRKVSCNNNMKQIALSLQNYHDAYRSFPAGWTSHANGQGNPGWGWSAQILAFAEQTSLAKSLAQNEPIANPLNVAGSATRLAPYSCPADRGREPVKIRFKNPVGRIKDQYTFARFDLAPTSYVGSFGSSSFQSCNIASEEPCNGNGVFYRNSFTTLRQLTDGSSHTLMAGERRSDRVAAVWAGLIPNSEHGAGRILSHAEVNVNDNSMLYGFSSFHLDGGSFVFGDGGIRFIRNNIDLNVLKALATRSGAELRTYHRTPLE